MGANAWKRPPICIFTIHSTLKKETAGFFVVKTMQNSVIYRLTQNVTLNEHRQLVAYKWHRQRQWQFRFSPSTDTTYPQYHFGGRLLEDSTCMDYFTHTRNQISSQHKLVTTVSTSVQPSFKIGPDSHCSNPVNVHHTVSGVWWIQVQYFV